MSYDTVATVVSLDVIEVGVITPVEPDLYVAVTSVVAESPKLIVFEPVLPPTLSTIDVTEFASLTPDSINFRNMLPPSPATSNTNALPLLLANVYVYSSETVVPKLGTTISLKPGVGAHPLTVTFPSLLVPLLQVTTWRNTPLGLK